MSSTALTLHERIIAPKLGLQTKGNVLNEFVKQTKKNLMHEAVEKRHKEKEIKEKPKLIFKQTLKEINKKPKEEKIREVSSSEVSLKDLRRILNMLNDFGTQDIKQLSDSTMRPKDICLTGLKFLIELNVVKEIDGNYEVIKNA